MDETNCKVSIVIPVYNRQTLVKRCLDSCISQTMPHEDYEIIVVDDCSTDNTYQVCQSYAEEHPELVRVFCLEENSGGASRPRNVGMDNARGEYVFFVDSDDTIIPETLADSYFMAKNGDCDLVIVRASGYPFYAYEKARKLNTPALGRADWTKSYGTMNDFFKLARVKQLGIRVREGLMGFEDHGFLFGFMFQQYDLCWNIIGGKRYYISDKSRSAPDAGIRSPWKLALLEYEKVSKTFAHILNDPRLADKDELALTELMSPRRRPYSDLLKMDVRWLERCSKAFRELVPVETDKYLSPRVAHIIKAIRDNDYEMYQKHVAHEIMTEERLALANYLEKRNLPVYTKRKGKRDVMLFGWHYNNNVGGCLTFYALHRLLRSAGLTVFVAQQKIAEKKLPRGKHVNYDLVRGYYKLTKFRHDKDWHEARSLADIFVTTSDQLWHSYRPEIWQLGCGDNSVKKIAVATSFGFDKHRYTTKQRGIAAYLYQKFDHISVREQSGVDILKGLGVEGAECILDPVFLCDPKEYEAVWEKATHTPEGDFVFAYILDASKDKYDLFVSAKNKVSNGGRAYAMSTPRAGNTKAWADFGSDAEFWGDATCADFLYALPKARFMITDSFHGACFAVMNHAPFLLIRNDKRGAAIFAFFEQLGLGERLVDPKELSKAKFTTDIGWDAVDEKLNALREKSFDWLDKAFGREFPRNYSKTAVDTHLPQLPPVIAPAAPPAPPSVPKNVSP